MINDILFCLLGKTGGIFIETDHSFEVNEKYTFLTDSEKELLKKIAEIGFRYSILDNFIDNYYKIFNRKLINSHFLLASNETLESNQDDISINLCNKLNNINKNDSNKKKNFFSDIKDKDAMDISELNGPVINNNFFNKNNLNSKNNNIQLTLQNFQDAKNDDYSKVKEFNNKNPENENNNLLNNLSYQNDLSDYLMPICMTIRNFLRQYEAEVTDIEAVFYTNLNLNAQYIISRLSPYSYKFDKIFDFLQLIINENFKGGELLNMIFNFSTNGDSEIKNFFVDMFINCNKIQLNYITSWIINGSLVSSEFFILSTNSIISQKNLNRILKNNIDGNFINNENFFLKEFENSKLELDSWNTNYYVEYTNIPTYFPQSIAEDILFIGKAIKVLNSKHNSSPENRISNRDMSVFYSSLQKLNDIIFDREENGINIINIEVLTKILNLIKSATGKYLWRLIIQQNNFMKYLDAIKNIYLTFSGEFYYNFINKIKALLNMPFDKRIEKEINEIHFRNSLKEVFKIDMDTEKNSIYGKFKIKLISHGINYDFYEKDYVKDLIHKKEIYLSNISYYDLNNCLRFTNTIFQCPSAVIWNMSPIDIDEEFSFNMNFTLKNFTKVFSNVEQSIPFSNNVGSNIIDNNLINVTGNFNSAVKNNNTYSSNINSKAKNENEILRNSLIKSLKKNPEFNNENDTWANDLRVSRNFKKSNVQNLTINVIMHNAKNFQTKTIPSNLESLINYFNFEFNIKYENLTNKPTEMEFNLKFVNKTKKALTGLNFKTNNVDNNKLNNKNDNFVEGGEYILQTKKFIISNNTIRNNTVDNKNNTMYLPPDFLSREIESLNINFKENFCIISNEDNSLDFKFHFPINDYFPKDKRKIFLGILLKSQNIDIALDLRSLNFNVLSGEIYNESCNLILIDYNPPWPHNFIFNDNILKMYNLIFNLLFPLKTNLILLNNIWIEKKNLAKRDNYVFTYLDAVHSQFVCFLQNLISFFMFDILELKFKNFISKCENCRDFEQIIKYHEEFLGEVISNSFLRSKKIMNIVFDILHTTRTFCNFFERTLNEINLLFLNIEENSGDELNFDDKMERIKNDLGRLKKEFNSKVDYLIEIFSKIKNSKYYSIISQLLIKLNFNNGNRNTLI